jgi:hypothetical protein
LTWTRTFLLHAVAAALVFLPAWGRGLLLAPDDGLSFFLPIFLSPPGLWDSTLLCGHPTYADPQAMLWYPLRHLPGGPPAWNAFVLSGFVLAGAFFHRWIARATRSELAGAVGGLAYALSGYPMTHLRHVNVLHTAAWIPAVLLAVDRVVEAPSRARTAALAAGVAMALLAGHPQTIVVLGSAVLLYGAARVAVAGASRRAALGACAGGAVLGVALAGVIVLPMLDLAARSFRALGLPDDSPPLPFTVRDLLRCVVAPALRGGGASPEARGVATEAFAGIGGTALALFALRRGGRRERLLAAIAAAGVLLALGEGNPVGRAVIGSPLFALFRVPARFLAATHLALLSLAAIAIASLARGPGRRLAPVAAGLVLLETAGFALFSEWRFHLVAAPELARPAFLDPVHAELARTGQRLVPIPGRLAPPDGAPPNRSSLWGIPTPAGYNPLRTADVSIVFDLNSRAQIPWPVVLGDHRAADLAATRYLTARVTDPEDVAVIEGTGRWRRRDARGDVALFERTEPRPRAWLASRAVVLMRNEILRAIRTAALPDGSPFDPRDTVLLETAVLGRWRDAPAPVPADEVEISLEGARVARIRTESPGRRILFVSEAHDQGWHALVDGAPATLVRANAMFLGVPLEAGAHEVELVYRPRLLRVGGAVSAAGALGLLVLLAGAARGRRLPGSEAA